MFPALGAEEQARVIGWMKEGHRNLREDLGPDDRDYMRKSWAHLHLSWIREHLTGDDLAYLEALDGEFGVSEESAEFSGYISGPFWGPTSPKNDDELKALAVPELVGYLQQWQPSGKHEFARFSPTREGLARQLQPIVKARAAEFAAAADAFIGLDATYVRAIIAGFEDAVKENVVLDWPAILRLCAWAVAQPRAIPDRDAKGFDSDPHWGWARAAIARLLRSGFVANDDARLPLALREQVWEIIEPITDDPNPEPDEEKDDRDPFSTAINSTRGVVMEAVMLYALWVRRPNYVPAGVSGFDDMPEFERVISRHIDPAIDPSRAIRAIYGQFLYHLFRLNRVWFEAHDEQLFPPDRPDLADAVLHSYLAWGQHMDAAINRALEPQFQRAIESLPATTNDEEKTPAYVLHVGQRLLAMYMHGDLDLADDSLFAQFFAHADEETRAHLIGNAATFVNRAEDDEKAAMRERAIAFWEWRLATSTDADLRGFGRWMDSTEFDEAWRLAQLEAVLRRVGNVDMDFQIAGMLGRFAAAFPAETLRCARLLVGAGMSPMKVHALIYRHALQRIIRGGLASPDADLQKDATAFANELVARGFNQFRDVLAPDYKLQDEDDED